jgi:hypothetical protein
MKHFNLKNNKGFALLFAALIGSLVLAIGIAILSVTIKQITLSSAGRESQHAFYSADSGIECANYLDRGGGNSACTLGGIFPGTVTNPSICVLNPDAPDPSTPFLYECLGHQITFDNPQTGSEFGLDYVSSHFTVSDNPEENICIDVTVKKYSDDSMSIDSRGYSTCNVGAYNRFERAVRSTTVPPPAP